MEKGQTHSQGAASQDIGQELADGDRQREDEGGPGGYLLWWDLGSMLVKQLMNLLGLWGCWGKERNGMGMRTGMGLRSSDDSPGWGTSEERAGRGLPAKITEMRGLTGAVAGGWGRGWRWLAALDGTHGYPANGMGNTASIAAVFDPWTTTETIKENSLLSLCKRCEAVSSRKPPSC